MMHGAYQKVMDIGPIKTPFSHLLGSYNT